MEQPKKKKKSEIDILTELEKINNKKPPQSIDLEKAVLGALLIQSDAIFNVQDILSEKSFYLQSHRMIYEAITDLVAARQAVDIMTVSDRLNTKGQLEEVGGITYLADLTNLVGASPHLEYHARIVHQKYIQRELIRASADIQVKSYDESQDVDTLISTAESAIFQIAENSIRSEVKRIATVVETARKNMEEARMNDNQLLGVPSGFFELDKVTSGWQPSDLVIIAARPSMGKTAFVLSMARNIAIDSKKTVAFFSLEMDAIQLVNRLLSAELEVPADRIRKGNLNDAEMVAFNEKAGILGSSNLFIDDTPAISVPELRAKCRRLQRTEGHLDIIIIDYLQLMTAGVDLKGNREQEVSMISRNLKAIAKELKVPVLALSQLNRSVEARAGDKKPQLSDLRESGAIEQDADMVMFVHRPEYYGITEDEDQSSTAGIANIIIAKHRNGAVGTVNLGFEKEYAKFVNRNIVDEGKTFESRLNDASRVFGTPDSSGSKDSITTQPIDGGDMIGAAGGDFTDMNF